MSTWLRSGTQLGQQVVVHPFVLRPCRHFVRFRVFFWGTCLGLLFSLSGLATPPEYVTFGRTQKIEHAATESAMLRIWLVFVEQGDGILIQLPSRYNYDPDPSDSDNSKNEQIDVLVDGGSAPESEAWRLAAFLQSLYGSQPPVIECAVVTHHDQDHVAGLTHLLTDTDIQVQNIFHNGLASYAAGKPVRAGIKKFPSSGKPSEPAVYDAKGGNINRGMAFLYPAGNPHDGKLDTSYLIENLAALRSGRDAGDFQGVYEDLADAILDSADGNGLVGFERAYVGAPFINDKLPPVPEIRFRPLWPLKELRPYGNRDWGETINGNSVTFRLEYGDFSMVFTGDHNEKSEDDLLQHLEEVSLLDSLNCDVFKVPHHGSSHALERFFQRDGFQPVVSVASMGDRGFKSKTMHGGNWQHPSPEVIDWLGGPHRVYLTFAHEKKFLWTQIINEAARQAMIERRHILIETDGTWFRVVEVETDNGSSMVVPAVTATRRGNGTRWIRAN